MPPSNNDSQEDILLRGVVRVENVENPEQYIAAVLKKTKPQHIQRTYDVKGFETPTEFLELLARKGGRLLKGGEADVDGVAKMVLNDFLRGKIPWFTPPPIIEGQEEKGIEGRKGALGEMGRVRKTEDAPSTVDGAPAASSKGDSISDPPSVIIDEDQDEFDGFDDETQDADKASSEGGSSPSLSEDETDSSLNGCRVTLQPPIHEEAEADENPSSELGEPPPRSLKRRRKG